MEHFTYLLLLLIFLCVHADEKTEDVFFVKPGAGTLIVQAELKKYMCKFHYTAQGGTHEEWVIRLEILDGGSAVACTVERDRSSYLFFQDFRLELTGPTVSITEVDIKNSQRDNLRLGKEEYEKDDISVSSSKAFKNHLEKVAVYSPLPRVDL